MEFVISSQQIIGLCAMITSIWAVRKIVKEINEPNDELKKIVKRHSEALDRDNQRLNKTDEDMKMILEVLYVTLEHQITGNHNNDMEATRKKLNEYLIHR